MFVIFSTKVFGQSITNEPTITPSPTLLPTPSVALNPVSGISLNEFMPNPEDNNEWIEIINNNNFNIKIEGWKIGDNTTNTRSIDSTEIPGGGIYSFFIGSSFLNNSTDSVRLINNFGVEVESYIYPSIKDGQSWSKVGNGWCLSLPTKGSTNNSCYIPSPTPTTPQPTSIPPTSIPTSSSTPAPTSTPRPTATPTAVNKITPTEPILTPSIEPTPELINPKPSDTIDPVLGIDDIIKPTPTPKIIGLSSKASKYLPILFIVAGGILMLSPLIISKINQ